MRDDFKWFRRARHTIYLLLWIQAKLLIRVLKTSSRRSSAPSPAHLPHTVLLVYRDFGNTNRQPLENLIQNLRGLDSETHIVTRVRFGNTLFGNAGWLRLQYLEVRPSALVVCDPQLLGLPGLLGMYSLTRLVRNVRRDSASVSLLLFDLPDPQGALFGAYLLRRESAVGLMCSTPSEGARILRHQASRGPFLLATAPANTDSSALSISKRDICVFLPRPSYEPRRRFVDQMAIHLSDRKISFAVGGNFLEYGDLQENLKKTRIAVVTNAIITGASGKWPRPVHLSHHLTYGNIEALDAGCLLLTEDCEVVRDVFSPGVNCLTFRSPADAVDQICWVLDNPTTADEIATSGRDFLLNQRFRVASELRALILPGLKNE